MTSSGPMPTTVEPMQPTLARQPFSNPDWLFEPKWDGFRAICFLQDGSVRFVSRNRKSLTERFPDLQRIAKVITANTAILDGEIVALDGDGVPCFDGLRSRKGVAGCSIVYFAFDVLYIDGRDLTQTPLVSRRQLEGMVAKRADSLYVSGRTRDWLKIKTSAGREEMRKRSEAWSL